MSEIGAYDIKLKRGDTYTGASFTFSDGSSAPIAITSARAQVRTSNQASTLLHSFTCTVSGAGSNVVSLSSIGALASAALELGAHVWDLELTLPDGRVRTWIAGRFTVVADVTR